MSTTTVLNKSPAKWYTVPNHKILREQKRNKIEQYIHRRLNNRRYRLRPMELKYNRIAKKLKYSYKEVRTVIDIMVALGKIKKYRTWVKEKNQYLRRNYYVIDYDQACV